MATPRPLSREAFQTATGVSRETLDRLDRYADALIKWQASVNLVGTSTLNDIWRRHFLDSAQLLPLVGTATRVADLGSGAGFPGLVLAILGVRQVELIEADQRKATFLREVNRICGAQAIVHCGRAETIVPTPCEVVTARALAPLTRLLDLARRWLAEGGSCLFLKGRHADDEIADARRRWQIDVTRHASATDGAASILQITGLRHV